MASAAHEEPLALQAVQAVQVVDEEKIKAYLNPVRVNMVEYIVNAIITADAIDHDAVVKATLIVYRWTAGRHKEAGCTHAIVHIIRR